MSRVIGTMLCHSTPTLCSTVHTACTHTHTLVLAFLCLGRYSNLFLPWFLSYANSQAFCVGIQSPHYVPLSCLRSIMKLGRLCDNELLRGIRPCLLVGGVRGPEKPLTASGKPCLSSCKVVQAEHLAVALRTYH